jgi:hypothetical protein
MPCDCYTSFLRRAGTMIERFRAIDAATARRLLRQTIEAGLHGQFHDQILGETARDAR